MRSSGKASFGDATILPKILARLATTGLAAGFGMIDVVDFWRGMGSTDITLTLKDR
jgi:hypothetical protein